MNIKKLSEVLYTNQPSENAHVIVEDGGSLVRTDIPSGGGVTPEIEAEIENAQWKTETTEQLFSETVTTVASELSDEAVASLSYNSPISADTITVTFDGVEYICEKHIGTEDNIYVYGGFDGFTEYPFYIVSEHRGGNTAINEIHTPTAGTHTVSVSTDVVVTTDTFKQAVNDIAGWKEESTEELFNESVTTVEESGVISATLDYSGAIVSDPLIVVFDGVEYTCPKNTSGGDTYYGAGYDPVTGQFDFTDFPFEINSMVDETTGDIVNKIATETVGEHTVVASEKNTTYTDAFKNGVIANASMVVNFFGTGEGTYYADWGNDDIINAFYNGTRIVGVIQRQSPCDGILFNLERVNTNLPTPEISFNAVVVINNTDIRLHRLVSYSDATGDGYELQDLHITSI